MLLHACLVLLCIVCVVALDAAPFRHPGLLHTTKDLTRMRENVNAHRQPWAQTYELLKTNPHASLDWRPHPLRVVHRGTSIRTKGPDNFSHLYNDAAAAYALALRWHIEGNDAYADHAVRILNAWAQTLERIKGTSDKYLASGLYGYQLANAAELLRDYASWPAHEFGAFVDMMIHVFYPMNRKFLHHHNGERIDHYWANWDLANMASMVAIGVLADNRAIFEEGITYFKHGQGNGAIRNAVWTVYDDGTGQVQESGRDQGHSTLVIGLLGTICQMAYNQHVDLFAYADNRVLAGAEYVAKYNLGHDVNFTTYRNHEVIHRKVSSSSRGNVRPIWELLYNHYVVRKGLQAPYLTALAARVRPEGGGGDYGHESGGYDQLGYGTLTFTQEEEEVVLTQGEEEVRIRIRVATRQG